MQFKLILHCDEVGDNKIPINYQYPLSAAIYKILAKGDSEYAAFLHEKGYGKGYKMFTFSDLKGRFKIRQDRIHLLGTSVEFTISFHLPEASRTFIEGLFRSERITIADKKSKVHFKVAAVLSQPSIWNGEQEAQIVRKTVRTASAIVSGNKKENGQYDFLSPADEGYTDTLEYSWRNKIQTLYDDETAQNALLKIDVEYFQNPYRSRLVTIKADTPEETKLKSYLNFKLKLTGEKRFVDVLLNSGAGVYNAQGMGCLEMMEPKEIKNLQR